MTLPLLPYATFPSLIIGGFDEPGDIREFNPGESVFLRDGYFLKGMYIAPIVCPDMGCTYAHTILCRGLERQIHWLYVGKPRYSVSPTLYKRVLEEKMPNCDKNAIRWWVSEGY